VAAPGGSLRPCGGAGHVLVENAFLTAGCARADAERLRRLGGTRAFAEEIIAYDVRTPGPDVAARALSGGNLQKFLMGRELMQGAGVIVINQPTWGVDAAAAAQIRQRSWTGPAKARRWW
jgi:ABC-type uncharacterized transport system ATPase subunit